MMQLTGCVMTDRTWWEKVESLSKSLAAVLIPVVLGGAGFLANQTLEKAKHEHDLLKQAIEVVFLKPDQMSGGGKSFESRRAVRAHWLETYNSLASVKLSNDFIALMMEQDTIADEKPLYWTGHVPVPIAKSNSTDRAASTNEDDLGHGWVAVGRLKSERYADVNFDIPAGAIAPDGTIRPAEIVRSRWSVTLRTSTANLEDRQDYSGSARGLLWGGACGKVIDSLVDPRQQTWAFVEIVPCPMTQKS
jgi:hypothetical protein